MDRDARALIFTTTGFCHNIVSIVSVSIQLEQFFLDLGELFYQIAQSLTVATSDADLLPPMKADAKGHTWGFLRIQPGEIFCRKSEWRQPAASSHAQRRHSAT